MPAGIVWVVAVSVLSALTENEDEFIPAPPTVKALAAIVPLAVKPLPVTVTTVPLGPLVGETVSVRLVDVQV